MLFLENNIQSDIEELSEESSSILLDLYQEFGIFQESILMSEYATIAKCKVLNEETLIENENNNFIYTAIEKFKAFIANVINKIVAFSTKIINYVKVIISKITGKEIPKEYSDYCKGSADAFKKMENTILSLDPKDPKYKDKVRQAQREFNEEIKRLTPKTTKEEFIQKGKNAVKWAVSNPAAVIAAGAVVTKFASWAIPRVKQKLGKGSVEVEKTKNEIKVAESKEDKPASKAARVKAGLQMTETIADAFGLQALSNASRVVSISISAAQQSVTWIGKGKSLYKGFKSKNKDNSNSSDKDNPTTNINKEGE